MPHIDGTPVARVVGLMLCGLAGVMLVPAAVDAALGNPDWIAFVESAAVTAFIGGAMVLATGHAGAFELNLRQAFLLTVACWLAVTAFSALPFLGLGLDYTDAFFEAISGITTTGSTVITGLDHLPPGILLWRSLLQWVGGLGIIVMAIVILPFLRVGGMQLFHTESSERSEKVVPSAFHLSAWIAVIYVTLTGLCALLYGIGEMSAFDALNHAMATLSTGGYSTHDASFAHFQHASTQWTGTVFMLAGAFPFVAYIRFAKGERGAFWRDPQIRSLLRFLGLSIFAMAAWLWWTREIDFVDALRLTAFNITSVVTTTGFASDDYGAWGSLAVGAFLIFTFVGGCTGSTSGAIKIYRHQIIWLVLRAQLMRLVTPRRVVILRYGSRSVPPDVPISVLGFVAVFLATVGLFTIALAGMGLDLQTALSASATALTNVGPGLGPVVGPATNFATLPDAAKWLLSVAMLLGRLEIFSVLVLFDPEFWRS
ncbi:TrkH family potassium uptake protein [Pelagibius sp. 7325]|uniref:TrkH family potassium uptake protein n=1 Tax=Pelagibius sp. 7325 TaxID=3131994 RepID=UPI0030EF649F